MRVSGACVCGGVKYVFLCVEFTEYIVGDEVCAVPLLLVCAVLCF
jgi:hypothetical protein